MWILIQNKHSFVSLMVENIRGVVSIVDTEKKKIKN